MVCQRPAQPAAAQQAAGKGSGRSGKTAASGKGGGGRGSASKRQKKARRQNPWSSSESEDEVLGESEDDFMVADSEEDEVIILNSEGEGEAREAGAAGPAAAAGAGTAGRQPRRGRDAVPASDSEGWSSSDDDGDAERQQRAGHVAATQLEQQQPAVLPGIAEGADSDARLQGPAQPLPPTQQADQPERGADLAGCGDRGVQQQQQVAGEEEECIPTRLIKQRGGSIHKHQVREAHWSAPVLVGGSCDLGIDPQRRHASTLCLQPAMSDLPGAF